MSPLPPSFTRLIERGPEGAAEFLQNVRPVTVARAPEEMPAAAGDNLCWIWQGTNGSNGAVRVDGETLVCRAYQRLVGPIPPGRRPWQECRNKLCVNPRHLALRTPTEIRSTSAGRLSPDERKQVLDLLAAGEREVDVASKFGISQPSVSAIKNKREVLFDPDGGEQTDDADQHSAQSLTEWLNRQDRRLGPVGQLARGEAMPEEQREKAFSKATKEFLTYQLLSREYETRRRENR
jgi:hypothetical protein